MAYKPPFLFRNTHVQTIFGSTWPRKGLIERRYKKLNSSPESVILNCNNGVKLSGVYDQQKSASDVLVILIHGWEGSSESTYMVSMCQSLYKSGYDVFRLNLRDHGDTHNLNKGVFNSTLIDEVVSAVEQIQKNYSHKRCYLAGFSLGGNFSMRVAARADKYKIKLQRVVVFSALIHGGISSDVLNEKKNFLYERHFVQKWKKSLLKKLKCFPEYGYGDILPKLKTLDSMNSELIPAYTEYDTLEEYFDAYAITGKALEKLVCPCHFIISEDDSIIPVANIAKLAKNNLLTFEVTKYGGHCGFIQNWKLESWQDTRLLQIIAEDSDS